MEVVIGIVLGIAGIAAGYRFGFSRGQTAGSKEAHNEIDQRLRSFTEAIARGRAPAELTPGSPEEGLQRALEHGWAPREAERERALHDAIGRVSTVLNKNVRRPLNGFDDLAGADELRERIGRALGAIQDIEFFITEPSYICETTDLGQLVQRVSREFVSDQNVGVRVALGDGSIRASVNPKTLLDALYLVLHNAARFGEGETVDLLLEKDDGFVRITVRDRGAGFSEEAFQRAFDPFYSTSDEGLGLGLPHARKAVEAMGGKIELRNGTDGSGEVEVSFSAS
ncbi:MAG: HAMP domain-containing sensor histidine kinase [Gemmatimonadota bacterium]|nr:HAMP domain-containing sensor histidine kinase [Gemmatimonadota bacterium]